MSSFKIPAFLSCPLTTNTGPQTKYFFGSSYFTCFPSRQPSIRHSNFSDLRFSVVPVTTATTQSTITASTAAESSPSPFIPFAPEISPEWEIDFYSRPVIGKDGKRLWEVIITDATGTLEHIEAIPNSSVNSKELRRRVRNVIDQQNVKPTSIRFFRNKMANMITIALSELKDIQVIPSRRTFALFRVLEDREKNVYPKMKGFIEGGSSQLSKLDAMNFDLQLSDPLPDELRGEKFAFVSLHPEQVAPITIDENSFGDVGYFDIELQEIISSAKANENKNFLIPGFVIYSQRARAIAAWMTTTEVSSIRCLFDKKQVIMNCGIDKSYMIVKLSDSFRPEARKFEDEKKATNGLHFLAVQAKESSDEIEGFWLLRETDIN